MASELNLIGDFFTSYNRLAEMLPGNYRMLLPLALIAVTIAAYAVFVWYFYRFLARRDIVKLNLNKYNNFENGGVIKFFAFIFYILEFIIISPIVISFWFSLFSLLFLILAKELELQIVILICAGIISATRITSYISEDLSKDLAKMFPFTLLGVVILTPGFFNIEATIGRLAQIPQFFSNIIYYFIFIVILEAVLRLIYLPFALTEDDAKEKE